MREYLATSLDGWLVMKYNNVVRKDPTNVLLDLYRYDAKEDKIFEVISEQNQILAQHEVIKNEIGL